MEFKEVLKNLRTARNISQAKLADYLNISSGTVGMYETGQRKPSYEMLEAIADFFNVDIDYLMGREETSTYILDPEAVELLKQLDARPELKVLLDASQKLTKEDVEAITKLIIILSQKL